MPLSVQNLSNKAHTNNRIAFSKSSAGAMAKRRSAARSSFRRLKFALLVRCKRLDEQRVEEAVTGVGGGGVGVRNCLGVPAVFLSAAYFSLRRAPPVNHRSSYQLRSLTGASDDFFRAFDARRVNGDSPF